MVSPETNRLERRGAQRFEVNLPVAVHFDGKTAPAFTQDLSGGGMFFYTEEALPEGAVIHLTFTMPSEITLGENMPVRCRGRVLRAVPARDGQRNGIAAKLDSYEYLPAEEGVPISQFARVSAAFAAPRPVPVLPR
jgi:PilZ domain